jgi:acyl-CoA hydrolase
LMLPLSRYRHPDAHGYCSLGTSVDVARAAVETAKYVIAQVNPRMPRTHGDGFLSIKKIDAFVWHESELPEVDYSAKGNEGIAQIGRNVATLIEDGATLQMGIGAIPDQVLTNLGNHKNLGIHTEMFSDGIIPLLQKGIITNSHKRLNVGRSVTGFLAGTRRLYDFVHDNPAVRVMDIAYVNDTSVIRQNPKVTAINSAIEIDLTGQVCADSIGTLQYSGIGGQMDFMRGRVAVRRRQTYYCAAFRYFQRRLADCAVFKRRCRRGYNPRPRALGGNRAWPCEFVWAKPEATR